MAIYKFAAVDANKLHSKNNPYLWMKSETTSRCHPLHKDGYKQLEVMGIEFSRRILRPAKEVVTIGWQPVLGWRFLQSA